MSVRGARQIARTRRIRLRHGHTSSPTPAIGQNMSPPASTPVQFFTEKHPFRFDIGASWAGKPPYPTRSKFPTSLSPPFPADSVIGKWRDRTLAAGSPAGSKIRSAGEDFFFIQEMKNSSGVAFGVADGVGGWTESGFDPSLFSQALMYHAHRYTRAGWAGEPEIDPTLEYAEREEVEGWEMTPFECLDLSYGGVMREKHVQAGASTGCIITLNASSGLLRSANIGDSGFSIIRSSNVIYNQPPQTHYFNCPLQLTKAPGMRTKNLTDKPSAADVYRASLRDGDIVVAYTDGLSDNVHMKEVLSILSLVGRSQLPEAEQPREMAENLVRYARECMRQVHKVSPFEREAKLHGYSHHGGKVDDVTVIVAVVKETP